MAKENSLRETVEALFQGMDGFVATKTVVGDAVQVGDTILMPLIDVQFGMGAGAFVSDSKERGAGGMNGKMTPSAVLVIKDGYTRMISVKNADTVSKIVDMVPDIINRFAKKESPEVEAKIEEIKNGEAADETVATEE